MAHYDPLNPEINREPLSASRSSDNRSETGFSRIGTSDQFHKRTIQLAMEMQCAFDEALLASDVGLSQMDLDYEFDFNDPVLDEISSTWNSDATFRSEVGQFGQFQITSDANQQIETDWSLRLSRSDSGFSSPDGNTTSVTLSTSMNNSSTPFDYLTNTEHMVTTDPLHQRFTRSMTSAEAQTPPRMFISPAECTLPIASRSLLDLVNEAAEEATKQNGCVEDSDYRVTTPKRRTRNRPTPSGGKTKPKVSKSQSKSSSPSPKGSAKPRRRSHEAGIDRKTGKLTLVGTYPPLMTCSNKVFNCIHPRCQESNYNKWTTRNGYKYHLNWVCPRNPKSVKSLAIAVGQEVKQGKAPGFQAICEECGGVFKSENGFKLHKTRNNGTRDGRCSTKRRRRTETQRQNAIARGAYQPLAPNLQGQSPQMMSDRSMPHEDETIERGQIMEDIEQYMHFD